MEELYEPDVLTELTPEQMDALLERVSADATEAEAEAEAEEAAQESEQMSEELELQMIEECLFSFFVFFYLVFYKELPSFFLFDMLFKSEIQDGGCVEASLSSPDRNWCAREYRRCSRQSG